MCWKGVSGATTPEGISFFAVFLGAPFVVPSQSCVASSSSSSKLAFRFRGVRDAGRTGGCILAGGAGGREAASAAAALPDRRDHDCLSLCGSVSLSVIKIAAWMDCVECFFGGFFEVCVEGVLHVLRRRDPLSDTISILTRFDTVGNRTTELAVDFSR